MSDDETAMETVDTSSMAVWPRTATQGAGNEQLRAKQPLDVRTATKGLFALGATGNAEALKALFDDCVLIDHTAQVSTKPKPTPTPKPKPNVDNLILTLTLVPTLTSRSLARR